jgi:hypothetical protein
MLKHQMQNKEVRLLKKGDELYILKAGIIAEIGLASLKSTCSRVLLFSA